MEWKSWDKKKIFIRLKTGDCYTGFVTDVDSGSDNSGFITIIDKYDNMVTVAVAEIIKIAENNSNNNINNGGSQ